MACVVCHQLARPPLQLNCLHDVCPSCAGLQSPPLPSISPHLPPSQGDRGLSCPVCNIATPAELLPRLPVNIFSARMGGVLKADSAVCGPASSIPP